ncbi:MAG: HIT domain-containing protein [Treponema sp.]|nr:HIT domain-containing protein [Treponema sp.]
MRNKRITVRFIKMLSSDFGSTLLNFMLASLTRLDYADISMEYFFNFEKIAYLKGQRPEGCILCLIRDRSDLVQDLTVFDRDGFSVSLNLYPYNPGHLILFPHRHCTDLRELHIDEQLAFHRILNLSLSVLDREYHPSAYNIGCNMGLNAGASIEHLHYHIIPRYPREIGIAELFAGKRVLVEHPLDSLERLKQAFEQLAAESKGI